MTGKSVSFSEEFGMSDNISSPQIQTVPETVLWQKLSFLCSQFYGTAIGIGRDVSPVESGESAQERK